MKILNYSSLSLLFTTIMQAVAGYSCPNVSAINTKIAENGTMRFPLGGENVHNDGEFFFRYRGTKNKIKKFYDGNSTVDKFIKAYYQPDSQEIPGSLTCTYKQRNNRYLLLPMKKREVGRIKEEVIANDINSNWQAFRSTSFYVCGEDGMTEDACQFHLTSRNK